MFYGNTVSETRQPFFTSWAKYRDKQPLSPLENQLVAVILVHPEYHRVLSQPEKFQDVDYLPEAGQTNPFLHMGLHLAVRDQIATDSPPGISAHYKQLVQKHVDPLAVEHLMIEKLMDCLWLAQKNNVSPDTERYLSELTNLCLA